MKFVVSVQGLDDLVTIRIVGQNSVQWQLRLEIEWSSDKEAELLVHALSSVLDLVAIEDSPLLIEAVMFWVNNNTLPFGILASGNVQG